MISFFLPVQFPKAVWLETTWQEGPGGHCPVKPTWVARNWHDNLGSLLFILKRVKDGFGSHCTGIWEILDEFFWKSLHMALGWSSCWDIVLGPLNLAEVQINVMPYEHLAEAALWAVRTRSQSEAQLLWLNDSHKRIPAQVQLRLGELWCSSGCWDSA